MGNTSLGTPWEGVWRSETGDPDTWEVFKPDFDFVSAMAFDSSGSIYVGTSGHYDNFTRYLYQSADYGETWEILHGGQAVRDIIILPDNDIYFCSFAQSSDPGIYFKSFDSTHLIKLDIDTAIMSIENLSLINNHLYAIHQDKPIVYKSINTISDIGIKKIEKESKLKYELYPNPVVVNGSIEIINSAYIKNKWEVHLFNSQGVCFFRRENIYSNKTSIKTYGLVPGVYIILIREGGEVYKDKIIIL